MCYNLLNMQEGYLPISVKVFNEGTSKDVPYVAYSPELDLSAAGKDPYSARSALQKIIKYVITKKIKDGNLDKFLKELGFRKSRGGKKLEAPELSFIQIPFNTSAL